MPNRSFPSPLPLTVTVLAVALAITTGCTDRSPGSAATASKPAPGTISVPFRNRWWHFYERGLSWSEAGQLANAEADFRQCLALRQTDSRQARTYGMHFVQCFAHRELGAVLLRQQRRDDARRELLLSMDQEPSAKAEYLLGQLDNRAAQPPVADAAPTVQRQRLEIASVAAVPAPAATAPVAASTVQVVGRVVGAPGATVWSTDQALGTTTQVPTKADGSFAATVGATSTLSLGTSHGPDQSPANAPVPVTMPADAKPELDLSGPADDAVIADGRAWYRYRAASAAGLDSLTITDAAGGQLAAVPLTGVRTAGTLRVDVPAGTRELVFRIQDHAGVVASATRRVESRPSPTQDRTLRAVALAIPLQSPLPNALHAGDDPRLFSALMEDGRFRFIDSRADELLARELSLVDAGYVDRTTAARAGRRLACRYVIAGTLNRGTRDLECFLRLIHCDSGRVVASADAYTELAAGDTGDQFFAAVAGRLRQVFPVVAGEAVRESDGTVALRIGDHSGAVALMRLRVFADLNQATARKPAQATVELTDPAQEPPRAVVVEGAAPAAGWAVSE